MIHLANAAFIKIAFGCSALLTVGVVALRLIAALTPSLETLAVAGLLDALPGAVTSGFANLLGLAEMSLRVLGPVVIISRSSVPAALACLLLTVPIAVLAQKSGAEAYQAGAQVAPHARRARYLKSLMSSREAAYERKLFGFGAVINEYWNNEMRQKIALDYTADKKIFIRAKSISGLFTLLLSVIALVLMLIVRQCLMTAGVYISLIIAFSQLIHTLSWQLSDFMTSVSPSTQGSSTRSSARMAAGSPPSSSFSPGSTTITAVGFC